MTSGRVNPNFRLDDQGISGLGNVYYNYLEPALIQEAKRDEHLGTRWGVFGHHRQVHWPFTKDKHVVKTPSVADSIWWENNAAMSPEGFDALHADMLEHMKGRDYFVQDLIGGSDPTVSINVRMVQSWHGTTCLFVTFFAAQSARNLTVLSQTSPSSIAQAFGEPGKHNCRSETVIAMNFDKKLILIGGTEYAGRTKNLSSLF